MNGPGISQSEREHRETEGAAVKAASSANGTAPPTEVTLSYGIELKIRKVPPLLVTRAQDQIEPPTIPTFYNTERQETEENPGHPDYVKAVERYNDRINVAAMNAMLLTGTSFVSAPAGPRRWRRWGSRSRPHALAAISPGSGTTRSRMRSTSCKR